MKYEPRFDKDEFSHPAKHLWFKGDSGGVVYALIHKNGCSAFKTFLRTRIHYRWVAKRTIAGFLGKKVSNRQRWLDWQVNVSSKVREKNQFIFVYRDPADRLISVFKNKFIDDSGNRKIFANFGRVLGISPEDACFNDLVEYTANNFASIDPHVWPQKAHLLPLAYTPIKLNQLALKMAKFVGPDLADAYFKRPVNPSSPSSKSIDVMADSLSVRVLRRAKSEGRGVTRDNLLTPENLRRIREIYWQDYEMIEEHLELSGCQ